MHFHLSWLSAVVLFLFIFLNSAFAACIGMECDSSVVFNFTPTLTGYNDGDVVSSLSDDSGNGYVADCHSGQPCATKTTSLIPGRDAVLSAGKERQTHYHISPLGSSDFAFNHFTIRACGMANGKTSGTHQKPLLFSQTNKNEVRYTLKGFRSDDDVYASYDYKMAFTYESCYGCAKQEVNIPGFFYNEWYCFYGTYDSNPSSPTYREQRFYADLPSVCGSKTLCLIGSRVASADPSTVNGTYTLMNYYSTTASGEDDPWKGPANSFVLANRPWTEAEILSDYAALMNQSNYCGDGTIDSGEQCDDGNRNNGDGCHSDCTLEYCGNNRQEGSEQCDGSDSSSCPGSCSSSCSCPVGDVCGDGSCTGNETFLSCSQDCPSHLTCQNNSCVRIAGTGTDSCSPEGSSCGQYCGNSICDGTETFLTCSQDCPSYLTCQNFSCTRIAGTGTDNCTPEGTICGVVCGDSVCNGSETYLNCSSDCPSYLSCVNNSCTRVAGSGTDSCSTEGTTCEDLSTSNCQDLDSDTYYQYDSSFCTIGNDCDDLSYYIHPGAVETCGDAIDQDCGGGDLICPSPPEPSPQQWCGDSICSSTESTQSCPGDCPPSSTGCSGSSCLPQEEAEPSESSSCEGDDCSSQQAVGCGNRICESLENYLNCPSDCSGLGQSACGDKICSRLESVQLCPSDCGICGDGLCTGNENSGRCSADCSGDSSLGLGVSIDAGTAVIALVLMALIGIGAVFFAVLINKK